MGFMHTNNNYLNKLKTLGSQAANLVTELYERGKPLFSYADVVEIAGLRPKSARSFVASLVQRGVVTRLKPGLFILVPFELGREREYLGNPYVVARELAGSADYYFSHASAMELHQMVTQPQLKVYTTTTRAIRPIFVRGTEFHFARCKPEHMFGVMDQWVTKSEKVKVSDPERTIIDGLKQSEYCGGFTEVAKGFRMRRDDLDIGRLVDYALRLDIGAVIRRLGFLLETFDVGSPQEIERLHGHLTATYAILDPLLPGEGKFLARWRLRLNVAGEEIVSVART
jgi:predicted transcriptional regulator of viral defense system